MTNFTLRVNDDELINQFDELAETHGMTRTAYIIQLMRDAVSAGYIPMRDGEGYRAVTASGGEITLIRHNDYVSGGMNRLSEKERVAFEQAKKQASPESGSQWLDARRILEAAGFKVYKL